MPSVSTLIFILIGLFLLSAFFSAAEAALISLNKVRLRHAVEQKKRGARRVYRFISRMDKLIATLIMADNLADTAIAAISTYLLTQIYGPGKGLLIVSTLVAVLLVVFGDLTPKIFATKHPERVAFAGRHLISFLIWIFSPLTYILTKISNVIIKLAGGGSSSRQPLVTEEEIKMMIQIGKEEGFYGDNERKMLERIFHFDEVEVRDVMTSLDQVAAVEIEMNQEEMERLFLEEGHNRIPVYKGVKSNIVGIVYVRDLLYLFKNSDLIYLNDLMSAPFFVPPHQKVAELLKEFQRRKTQIAIVRDVKTQKAIGLVTLEDLIEEIVGEIEEEIDTSLTK